LGEINRGEFNNEKKEKIFSKKIVVVKEMFLSLQPRFFEKIFWKLKKDRKAAGK